MFALWTTGALATTCASADGLPPAEALKQFKVAPGFRVQLFASEPEIRQPVSMSFDPRGRMWVIQYLQYPTPAGLKVIKVDQYLRTVYDKVPEPPPAGPRGADRITICEDTDGDGKADKFKDFVSTLNLATGLALGHGGVFVVQAPYLLYYADRNGDDVPDGDPEVLLTGFGMEDAHALANSLQWGPDGWLYGAQGSTVTAHIRGVTFQQGIWRYHPRTRKFELFAEGGGNTWGADFDRHGNMIAGTNYGERAMLHQVQGAYYVKGFAKHGELQNPYAFGYFEHVPYRGFKGGHVTCGGIVYQGGSFPEKFHHQYIAANVLSNAIYWHAIDPKGSSFENHFGGELLTSEDSRFRPVDCTVGPDGSLFAADWYDKRANHVDPKDDWDRSNGRIYKITADGTKPVQGLELAKRSSDELVSLLGHANEWYVREARNILAERRDASVLPRLKQMLLSGKDPHLALEAFWALYVGGGFDDALAVPLLKHPEADVRTWAVRLLGDERQVSPVIRDLLVELAGTDKSPVVRSQLAATAKRLPSGEALPLVARLLARDEDVADPHIPLLLWWAVEDKTISDRQAVLAMFAEPSMWKSPLVQAHILERLAQRYAAAGKDEDFASCAQLLAAAPGPVEVELLVKGMEKGLAGRKFESVPKPLVEPLTKLWKTGGNDTALIRCAMRLGSEAAHVRAEELLAASSTPQNVRLAMIEITGQIGRPTAVESLLTLVDEPQPPVVQMAAMGALQRFADPRVPEKLLTLLPRMKPEVRTRAQGLLASRQPWALALLTEVDQGRMQPAEIAAAQLSQMTVFADATVNKLIEKHWGSIAQESTAEKRARIHGINVSLGLAQGDLKQGKQLYTKHCGTCHTLFGEGGKIGPDLTSADRKQADVLLTNIVDPSAVIRKEFFNYVVQTKDGRVFTGLLAESTPQAVTVLDAKNERTVIAQDEIEEIVRSPQSLMPEKILDDLDAQQVRDLIRYLRSSGP